MGSWNLEKIKNDKNADSYPTKSIAVRGWNTWGQFLCRQPFKNCGSTKPDCCLSWLCGPLVPFHRLFLFQECPSSNSQTGALCSFFKIHLRLTLLCSFPLLGSYLCVHTATLHFLTCYLCPRILALSELVPLLVCELHKDHLLLNLWDLAERRHVCWMNEWRAGPSLTQKGRFNPFG